MKFLQLRIGNGLFQILILKFGHFAAFRTYHVMMGFIIVRTLVLGRVTKLMFYDQLCINKQNNSIIKSGTADAKLAISCHIIIERINVKVPFDGIDSIEYSIPFGRLSMPVPLQVLS